MKRCELSLKELGRGLGLGLGNEFYKLLIEDLEVIKD